MIYLALTFIVLNLGVFALGRLGSEGHESWLARFFTALGFTTIALCGIVAGSLPSILTLILFMSALNTLVLTFIFYLGAVLLED